MLNESDVMRRKVIALGKTVPPRQDDLKDLEHFLCVLYGDKESLSVNQTRYNMYCKSQSLQSHQLSPTESALLHHFKRANYQTYIWKNMPCKLPFLCKSLKVRVGKSQMVT